MTKEEAIKNINALNAICMRKGFYDDEFSEALKMATDALKQQKTGEWVGEADGYADGELVYDVWYCSTCDYCIETDEQDELPNYCPNCGTKMRF